MRSSPILDSHEARSLLEVLSPSAPCPPPSKINKSLENKNSKNQGNDRKEHYVKKMDKYVIALGMISTY